MTFMKFIKIFNLREECPVVYLAVHIGFLAKFQWRFVCCNRFHNTIRTAYHSLRFQVSTTRKVVWFHVTTFEKGMKRRGSCQIGLDFQRLEWMKSMLQKKYKVTGLTHLWKSQIDKRSRKLPKHWRWNLIRACLETRRQRSLLLTQSTIGIVNSALESTGRRR